MDKCIIMQSHSPVLYCQVDLPGPRLLVEFWQGKLKPEDIEEAWKQASKGPRKPASWNWMDEMPLFCRGCSDLAGQDVCKRLADFPHHGSEHIWDRVISLGME